MTDEGKIRRPPPRSVWKTLAMIAGGALLVAAVLETGFKLVDPEGYQRAKAERDRESGIGYGSNHFGADVEPAVEAKPASGEHCLSGWDGANRDLVRQVKASMRDPDSFEHVDTRIYGNDNGEHGLWMTFRARNGFGGMNVERVYARIDHESCKALRFGNGPGI